MINIKIMKNNRILKINEIFKSIQGESTRMGIPCTFIRLTYCNLRCSYCDTEYAFHEGKDMTIDEILKQIKSMILYLLMVRIVCIACGKDFQN